VRKGGVSSIGQSVEGEERGGKGGSCGSRDGGEEKNAGERGRGKLSAGKKRDETSARLISAGEDELPRSREKPNKTGVKGAVPGEQKGSMKTRGHKLKKARTGS